MNLSNLTIKAAAKALRAKEFSVRELAEAYLKQIESENPEVNAYLEVYDDVLAQADAAQKRIDAGEAGELIGIPIAMKDNILVKGKRASAASKILEGYRATYDATAAAKLKAAGAVLLGRTNMDEFAMGSSTENSAYGVTKNPIDRSRVAGGSSGGSAAAVAGDMALAALGSETGGSIRQPASLCGIVGLKTTYGSVSRHGLMAMGSSLDQIGPMARDVSGVETLFRAIKGHDPMDSTSVPDSLYASNGTAGKEPKTIGVPKGVMDMGGVDEAVKKNFSDSLERLASLGYEIRDIDLPYLKYSLPAYYVIVPAEVSSNLARFDGVKYGLHKDGRDLIDDYFVTRGEGFGAEARRRILLGTYVLSSGYYDAYYNKAVGVRKLVEADFRKAFEGIDAIATPTTPSPAFKIGEKVADPIAMYLEDIFTVSANIAGIPAISLPSGFSETDGKKLPLGLQILGPHGGENALFAIGKRFLGESADA